MKILFSISLCLFLTGATYSQITCSNVIITSPVVSKPTEGAIVSSTCSTLLVKWKGGADQSYVINATFKDPVTNVPTPTDAATDISCDNDQHCTAIIPVAAGTRVNWSVQAVGVMHGRTFYSYPLRVDQDYPVPDCSQPIVIAEEPAAVTHQSTTTASGVDREKLVVSNDKLAMYPNPVTNILNVKISSAYSGNARLSIVDISGREVKSLDLNKQQPVYTDRITLSGLKPGMYYLSIRMKKSRPLTARFIKN